MGPRPPGGAPTTRLLATAIAPGSLNTGRGVTLSAADRLRRSGSCGSAAQRLERLLRAKYAIRAQRLPASGAVHRDTEVMRTISLETTIAAPGAACFGL